MSKFKFHFKNNLPHQTEAIESVLGLFKGMKKRDANFTIVDSTQRRVTSGTSYEGTSNHIAFSNEEIAYNLEDMQKQRGLIYDEETKKNGIVPKDFTIEMETGTGKTYVYIKTALELSKNYGLRKFIIVVPSVAIREGVKKTLEVTKSHFENEYDPYNFFIYNSKDFSNIKEFARSKNTQIMVINIDAFNKEIAKINQPQEATDGNRPIDLIKKTNPLIIIDEPQSVIGKSTPKKPSAGVKAIIELNPLMVLRYSATHRLRTFDLYKLDAVDAYNEGLVKEIVANSIVVDEDFNEPYIYLVDIDREKKSAKLRLNVKLRNKFIRKVINVNVDDHLAVKTGNNIYEGFYIREIGFVEDKEYLKISNVGYNLDKGNNREFGQTDADEIKRFQIRETIKEHLEKEVNFRLPSKSRGRIKVLSLFFIDKVANYVNYEGKARVRNGKYAVMFEEEYKKALDEKIEFESNPDKLKILNELKKQDINKVHDGYFSKDKATSFSEYSTDKDGSYKLTTKDDGTFDLIMKDKEKLLDLDNSLRFIFSHSALKEGWDNPNVFQICTLNETKSEIKKRQEIGRGLRLAVDEFGNRIEEGINRNVNKLTVMVNESYEEFTEGLQKEYEQIGIKFGVIESDTFSHLPSKLAENIGGEKSIEIYKYLKENDYLDKKDKPNNKLREDIKNEKFFLPEHLNADEPVIIKKLMTMAKTLEVRDGHVKVEVKRSDKILASPEFLELWNKIKHKTRYEFKIDSKKLVEKGIESLKDLDIDSLNIISKQAAIKIEDEQISTGENELKGATRIKKQEFPNVLFELQNSTKYSRNDIGKILHESGKLYEITKNPQRFILEVTRRLNNAMDEYLIEEDCIRYVKLGDNECYVQENIFEESIEVFEKYVLETKDKSVYPSFEYDSSVEFEFAKQLEDNKNVMFYTKLPASFKIDTPIGAYNPDWALVYNMNNRIKVYFVIETKSTKEKMEKRGTENYKIHCAKLHFAEINKHLEENIEYEVMTKHKDVEKMVLNKDF